MNQDDIAELYGDAAAILWTAAIPVRNEATRIAMTLGELSIEVDADLMRRVVALAEKRVREEAERDQRVADAKPFRTHQQIVYYMRQGDLVKIGTTQNVWSRTEALSVQGVMAVEFGGYDLEKHRHQEFARLHHHGEWFTLDQQLAEHVVKVRETFEQANNVSTEAWLDQYSRRRVA